MPYTQSTPTDGLAYLKSLIDEGSLIKVIDEKGQSIELKSQDEWMNTIGDFIPGKGYEIKVSKNTAFRF